MLGGRTSPKLARKLTEGPIWMIVGFGTAPLHFHVNFEESSKNAILMG